MTPVPAPLREKLRQADELRVQGRFDDARALGEEILRAEPRCFDALYLLGVTAAQTGNPGAAVTLIDKALAINPGHAAAYCNRGAAQQALGQLDAALGSYEKAVSIKADYALAHNNRGYLLAVLGRPGEALQSFDAAIRSRADYAEAHVGRGNAFKALNQLQAALDCYDRAIALRADYAEAYFNRAIARLLDGDFERGWIDFEWRWRKPQGSAGKLWRDFPQPLWLGAESIAAKTLFVHCETGLGDTLQFCRYAKLLSDLRARVILQVQPPLIGVLAGLAGVSQLLAEGDAPPDFDYHCPLLSLPLAFKTRLGSIPAPGKYLTVGAARVAQWRAKLADSAKPCVGLIWRGDPNNREDRSRSIPLREFLQQLPTGPRYVSLQREVQESERQAIAANPAVSIIAETLDFADTAAVCECLDLVISVDTSVAHLSAALAGRTWILLSFSPDCRWLLHRQDSPWYPSVTLYRQEGIGDWRGVLARVAADLMREFPGEQSARR
ncbi:MAG: tetratricopeptide repeat protein [Steroidobacteraceae bacterium]